MCIDRTGRSVAGGGGAASEARRLGQVLKPSMQDNYPDSVVVLRL